MEVVNGISTTNRSSTRLRNSSDRSTFVIDVTSTWWLTQTMPIMQKLSRYARKACECSWS